MDDGLENQIKVTVQNIIEEQVEWDYAFGTTKRENGQTVIGNPRDTIDTGETFRGVKATVSPNSIRIDFEGDDSEYIFTARHEIDDIAGERIGSTLAVDIVKYILKSTGLKVS